MPPRTLLVTNWGTVHAALCPEGVSISVSFQVVRTLNACSCHFLSLPAAAITTV